MSPAGIPWTDFRRGISRWMGQIYTSAEWFARNPNRCALFDLPGMSIHGVVADTMHNKHMGTDMWFLGSVLQYLVYYVMEGALGNSMDVLECENLLDASLGAVASVYIYIYIFIERETVCVHMYIYIYMYIYIHAHYELYMRYLYIFFTHTFSHFALPMLLLLAFTCIYTRDADGKLRAGMGSNAAVL